MLKIKDSLDLKELEKFGFKNDNMYNYLVENDYYKRTETIPEIILYLNKSRQINIECDDCYYNIGIEEFMELIYDLIKADMVEKV